MFTRQAQKHGAELVCLKKAHQFQQWLATAEKPYALFTDWREGKQCNEAMTVQGLDGQPMFTSVFCVDVKQQCRAERWASTLPERQSPVYVHRNLSSAESIVKRLLHQASELQGSTPLTQLKNNDVQPSCMARNEEGLPCSVSTKPIEGGTRALQRTETILTAEKKVPVLSLPELTWPKNGNQVQGMSQQNHLRRDVGPTPPSASWPTQFKDDEAHAFQEYQNKANTTAMPMVANTSPQIIVLHWRVAAHVAQIWKFFSCPAEVEKALLAAMPDSYEE